ncbi:MAG: hypothetical protein ABI573_06335 [Chloroflexota bacterium]
MEDEPTFDDDLPEPPRPRRRREREPDRGRGGAPERPDGPSSPFTPDRTTRRLAMAAVVLALVAFGFTAWRALVPAASSCQSTVWSATPAAASLPQGWTTTATLFDPDRLSLTFIGPAPADQTSSQAVIYATVSCFHGDAADAVTRSEAAANLAGQTVASRSDLGDQGYSASSTSGASFIQFRTGDVVVSIAGSGSTTAAEVEAVASAFDVELGGTGSTAVLPTAQPSDAGATPPVATAAPDPFGSAAPSAAPSAPELEALLPKTASGVPLTVNSAVGSAILGTDPGSRAIIAALTAAGIPIDDFHAAEAYEPGGTLDLSVVAFRAIGMDAAAMRKIVLDTWLAGTGAGVTTTDITVGGRTVTQVNYGDSGTKPYLLTSGDAVIVITTSDSAIAAEVVAAIP